MEKEESDDADRWSAYLYDGSNVLKNLFGVRDELIWQKMEARRAELPPHTRRRVLDRKASVVALGTTSAYAEKSEAVALVATVACELPPHTRRRGAEDAETSFQEGTTSAYAEKSSPQQQA